MKTKHILSIVAVSFFVATIACIVSTTQAPNNISANITQIPTTHPTNSVSANTYPCINKYVPIVNDATKVYAVNTTNPGSTVSSTNYETIFYFSGSNSFTVQTRLEKRVGNFVDENWNCTRYGFTKISFAGWEFLSYFRNKNGMSTIRTGDICPSGVTLPTVINIGDKWKQETDFEFTSSNLSGLDEVKWKVLRESLDAQTLPLPAGSGRFIYNYKATKIEKITVPAGTFDALQIDVTAAGYLDPSRVFSPTFEYTSNGEVCRVNSNKTDEVNPLMSLTFKGSTWWAPKTGWVKKVGTISNSQGEIESYEMELESIEVP